jgi:hypothetical protein
VLPLLKYDDDHTIYSFKMLLLYYSDGGGGKVNDAGGGSERGVRTDGGGALEGATSSRITRSTWSVRGSRVEV